MTASMPHANAVPMVLRCPKCHGDMATYERSGIVVDQCRECRGIWLDRGELEKLVDAESRHGFALPTERERRPERDDRERDRYDSDRGRDRDRYDPDRDRYGRSDRDRDDWPESGRSPGYDRDGGQPRRKRSLLGDLLEGFGD